MSILLQGASGASPAQLLLFYLVIYVIVVPIVSVFLHRDAKRRGASPGVWIAVWCLLALVGLIGYAIFALVYLTARPKQVLYDTQGNPLLPAVPPGPMEGAPPPSGWPQPGGWTPAPPPPPSYGPSSPPTAPQGWQPAPPPGWQPGPSPAPAQGFGPKPSKVKCPRCHTIFEYYGAPAGPTHVKCPACGEEGNI
ncbi:MAG: hypothetical protein HYT80_02885 [Euryarchaeota archaeon]|nr:hypothetical protein [Euryarchaeota archaeon]